MTYAFRPQRLGWGLSTDMRLARSGTIAWALGKQLSALERRRRLRLQQEGFQRDAEASEDPLVIFFRIQRPPS